MLSREQTAAFFSAKKLGADDLKSVPNVVIHYMHNVSAANFDPNGKIAKLLKHIADGLEKDLIAIREMLDADPSLVLQAGNVMTRAGLLVLRTTPLECALGSGSPEIAAIIAPYFDKIKDGSAVRDKIYKRYLPHIEKMLQQEAYDFTPLLVAINASKLDEIEAALNNELSPESDLYKALENCSADFTPDSMTVGMHFNYNKHCSYQTVLRALELYESNFNYFTDFVLQKNKLFARHVYGLLELSFTSEMRIIFARNGFQNAATGRPLDRSLVYRWCTNGKKSFPDRYDVSASSYTGLRFADLMASLEFARDDLGYGLQGNDDELKEHFNQELMRLKSICGQDPNLSPSPKQ